MGKKWEYLIFERTGNNRVVGIVCKDSITVIAITLLDVDRALDKAGELGWELVCVTPENHDNTTRRKFYLKRQCQ